MVDRTVTHTGPHGTVTVNVNVEAHTSDGQPRPNTQDIATMAAATISYAADWSQRVKILNQLGVAAGVAHPIDPAASYDNSTMVQRINDISTKVGGGLPIYSDIDINSFNSIVYNIAKAMGGA